MELSELEKTYYAHLDTLKIREVTRNNKKFVVHCFINFLALSAIKVEDCNIITIENFIAELNQKQLKASSINNYLIIIRQLYAYLFLHGLIKSDCCHLVPMKKKEKPLPKNVPVAVINQLCTPVKKLQTLKTVRDQAILEFFISTGVRKSEVVPIRVKQLSHDLTECQIATGKRGKDRVVFLGRPCTEALLRYFEIRGISVNSKEFANEPLFASTAIPQKPLASNTIGVIIKKISLDRLGYTISPHQLRHAFATEMLRGSQCLRSVQLMLGHKKISSTKTYIHLTMRDKIKTIELYHPRDKMNIK